MHSFSARTQLGGYGASLILISMAVSFLGIPPTHAGEFRESRDTFTAGARPIQAEYFRPSKAGRYPGLLLLHGSDGLKTEGATLRWLARDLAQQGYVVMLVHYLDRSGITAIAPAKITPEHQRAWRDTVCQARHRLAKQPDVDARRIGVVGLSLGGFLAVGAAAEEEASIAAVVVLFGGLASETRRDVKRMPPAYIIHGDRDRMVPVAEAHKLKDFLTKRQSALEIKIYHGVGHVFLDANGTVQMSAALDARQRATRFLERHLHKDSVARQGK